VLYTYFIANAASSVALRLMQPVQCTLINCWMGLMPPDMVLHQVASMLHKRGSHACTACQGKLYVMGGWDSTDFLASVEVMDPRINAWQVNTRIPYASHRTPLFGTMQVVLRCARGLTLSTAVQPPLLGVEQTLMGVSDGAADCAEHGAAARLQCSRGTRWSHHHRRWHGA